ncbi:hypothetical protein ACQY0O_001756 [Thecaphora frezii]
MGISGLLPLLKDIQTSKHVSDYRGQTLGVDAYVWLHRGAYGCAREIVLKQPTDRYIAFAVGRIRLLQHHGVKPYIVFDGDKLPAKQGTEDERQQRRTDYLERARALERAGKLNEARDLYAKCVDVTPEMAYQLIKLLRREGIPYVVAPYEADAQLAFLERRGLVDGIITEDSDLLVFGCEKVLFKLDQAGHCTEILRSRFALARQVVLGGWTPVEFRQMAILSGCDYLPSIVGMGLKNAHRLLRRYKTVEKVLQAVRLGGKMRVPHDYAREFRKAELTFVHQRVWDPQQRCMATLTPLPDGTLDEMVPFIGAPIDDELARRIAEGDVDPVTRLPMVDLVPTHKPQQQQLAAASPALRGGQRSLSWTDKGGAAHPQPPPRAAFSRSTTSGPSLSPFYRSSAGQPRAKPVSTESGLQTIRGFFGVKPSPTCASAVSATGAGARATAGTSRPVADRATANGNPAPLETRDANSLQDTPDRGKRKAVDEAPAVDQDENAPPRSCEPGPRPVRSKFFQTVPADAGRNEATSMPAYLELDGRALRTSTPASLQAWPCKVWEGCEDMDEFVKSSPVRPLSAAAAGADEGSAARDQRRWQEGKALGSSSPFATPQDDEVSMAAATVATAGTERGEADQDEEDRWVPPRPPSEGKDSGWWRRRGEVTPPTLRRKRKVRHHHHDGEVAEDSEASSGFISSPASSVKPQRRQRHGGGCGSSDALDAHDDQEGDLEEASMVTSSPISPLKARRTNWSTVAAASGSELAEMSSDPIVEAEADGDVGVKRRHEEAAKAVGRSLMAKFGWRDQDASRLAAAGGKGVRVPPLPPRRMTRRSLSDQTQGRCSPVCLEMVPVEEVTPTRTRTVGTGLGSAGRRSRGTDETPKAVQRSVSDADVGRYRDWNGQTKVAQLQQQKKAQGTTKTLTFRGEVEQGVGADKREGLARFRYARRG